jgi:hypothetical protein
MDSLDASLLPVHQLFLIEKYPRCVFLKEFQLFLCSRSQIIKLLFRDAADSSVVIEGIKGMLRLLYIDLFILQNGEIVDD